MCENSNAPSVSSINRILRNRAAERAAAEFTRNYQLAAAAQAAQAMQYGNASSNPFDAAPLLSQPLMNGALMANNPLMAAVAGGNAINSNTATVATTPSLASNNGLLTTATPSATVAALNSTNLALMGLMNGTPSSPPNGLPNGFAAAQQLYAAWAAYAALANGNNSSTTGNSSNGNNGNSSTNSTLHTNGSTSNQNNNSLACDSSASNNSNSELISTASVDSSKSEVPFAISTIGVDLAANQNNPYSNNKLEETSLIQMKQDKSLIKEGKFTTVLYLFFS